MTAIVLAARRSLAKVILAFSLISLWTSPVACSWDGWTVVTAATAVVRPAAVVVLTVVLLTPPLEQVYMPEEDGGGGGGCGLAPVSSSVSSCLQPLMAALAFTADADITVSVGPGAPSPPSSTFPRNLSQNDEDFLLLHVTCRS